MKSMQDISRKEYSLLASENVRLTNLAAGRSSRIKFLEEENGCLASELNESEGRCLELERAVQEWKEKCASLEARVAELESERSSLESLARGAGTDYESVVNMIRRRTFNTNRDATRYLNGEVGVSDARLSGLNLNDLVEEITRKYVDKDTSVVMAEGRIDSARRQGRGRGSSKDEKKPRRVYTEKVLSRMGIDATNLPAGAKLIRRRKQDGSVGHDEWVVVVYDYIPGSVGRREYVVGRFNVPG